MMYFLDLFGIGDAIVQALRSLCGSISALLYEFISTLYTLFIYISKAQILENDFINSIYRKVGMLLGLFMVFKLSFSLIQYLIEPDKFSDNQKGFASIIKRIIIAIVLLGITPSLFKEAYNVQNMLVGSSNRDNVIYKLIVSKNSAGNFNTLGRRLAADMFFSFFTDNEEPKMENGVIDLGPETEQENRFPEDNIPNLKSSIEEGDKSFHATVPYLAQKVANAGEYVIEYNWLLSIGFAIIIIWMFITYCLQVGTRVVQLAYLQIIAPIPILSYVSDTEGTFKKWTKQCTTTYLDLFIRLAIIYFIMTVISDIIDQFNNIVDGGIIVESTGLDANSDSTMITLVKLFIILGLLMFGKKVPELLKDLFPNIMGGTASLGFGIKTPKKTLEEIPGYGFAKGAATLGAGVAIGGIAGMASGMKNGYGVRGKLAGTLGGLKHGVFSAKTSGNIFKNAQTGMSNTRNARKRALENSSIIVDYQKNEDILAAKKAIDDRAESELLKTDRHAQLQKIKLDYFEANVGKRDARTGNIITRADVVNQRSRYKTYMDGAKETWVDTHRNDDKEVAKQMQIIQNKSGHSIKVYSDVKREADNAKTKNASNARREQKMHDKKNKIK